MIQSRALTVGRTNVRDGSIPSLLRFACLLAIVIAPTSAMAAGGLVTVSAQDEQSGHRVPVRMELFRVDGRAIPVRRSVDAGSGFVLNRSIELPLPDGRYRFRLIRGPEYRVISGDFVLERTSLDAHTVKLVRMANLLREGWVSGDMAVPPSSRDVAIRMMAEDLHFASVIGRKTATPVPRPPGPDPTAEEQRLADPIWIREDVSSSADGGLLFFPHPDSISDEDSISDGAHAPRPQTQELPSAGDRSPRNDESAIEQLRRLVDQSGPTVHVAIANPFAWQVPLWLATENIDGWFLMGDWLAPGRSIEKVARGRPPVGPGFTGPLGPGRYAQSIHWRLLDAGLRLAPLAGSGPQGEATPIGYNRLYVTQGVANDNSDFTLSQFDDDQPHGGTLLMQPPASASQWMRAAWAGQSVATNGPLLRPLLGGHPPGHVFEARSGEVLELAMELKLDVRDPVDYLEVIHNGRVFFSARLDEFSLAGGRIPLLSVEKSGWVLVQVVTQHDEHLRAAISAPWYIQFDGTPRVSRAAVDFFVDWLRDTEQWIRQQSPKEIARNAPHVRAARTFWADCLQAATDP